VSGDEVNAGGGPSVITLVEIGAAGEAQGKFSDHAVGTAPKIPHAIAVFTVPFRPAGRKFPHLITAFPNIPRLGDEFYLRDYRILVDDIEECAESVYLV
jgi:hypothetical protein